MFFKKNKKKEMPKEENSEITTANPEEMNPLSPEDMYIGTMPTDAEIIPKEIPIEDLEHILTIDGFIQIRIYLPKISDINIFKEKLEKINKLLNNPEFQKSFLVRR